MRSCPYNIRMTECRWIQSVDPIGGSNRWIQSVDPIGGTIMAIAENKSERIEVRTTPNMKALLQRAAASSHKNVTEFLLEAGINAAEDALVDRRIFRLDDRQWQAFQAILDRPVAADKPRLTRLLAEKSVLE